MSTTVFDNSAEISTSPGAGQVQPCTEVQSFIATVSGTLASLSIGIQNNDTLNGTPHACQFDVELWSADGSGNPSAVIATLATNVTTPVIGAGPSSGIMQAITLAATPSLSSGNEYFIALTDPYTGFTGIAEAADATGTGITGTKFGTWDSTCGFSVIPAVGSNPPYIMTVVLASTSAPTIMKFAGRPAGLPTIAADLRGIVMVIHGLNSTSGLDILQMANTVDVVNFAGWKLTKLWDQDLDTGPPPPNLKTSTPLTGHFLSRDITDAARGRAFLSITAADSSVAGNQALYVGLIEWDAVTPA